MNAYLAAVLTVLAPLYVVLIPAVAIVVWHRKKLSPPRVWLLLGGTILFLLLFTVFSIPFLFLHDGLPAGDSQKAIIWANLIQQENRLPNYQQAIRWLNRDPADFFTPGLHILVAAVSAVSPHPLVSVGLLSIALSIITALIGGAVAAELTTKYKVSVFALTVIFILTNFRFLRYLREPGYHLQNIFGELLLFSLLWLALRLLRSWRWPELLLAIAAGSAILVSHQFTAFLAPFLLAPVCVLLIKKYPRLAMAAIVLSLVGVLSFWLTGLTAKLPHLFTSDPHLLSLTPTLADYPTLLSLSLVLAGLIGWIYLAHQRTAANLGFVAGAVLLLALSQAPQLGLDIPPVRALFYSIVPLSIGAAFAGVALARQLAAFTYLRTLALAVLLLAMTVPPVSQAFNISHSLRTNSTLLPEQLTLIDIIKENQTTPQEAVLIDDYNRRSASWLVLSGQPMFTRLAADIATQQNEARQSPLRRSLYLNQLDFEKIFSLGSQPEIAGLLTKHNIRWITGIDKSSAIAFARNPILLPAATGRDINLFKRVETHPVSTSTVTNWLLKPSTLVNDIGDEEDEFKHLPVSLRATNLSEPQVSGPQTFRTTTAPRIPVMINVRDYVAVLWDQDKDNKADGALQLLIRYAQDPGPREVTTSTGQRFIIHHNQPLTLPASASPINDGLITLIIENPTNEPLSFDLVALGLAPTP